MVRREIEIDEATDRLLCELASDYGGNLSLALCDLLHARDSLHYVAERTEAIYGEELRSLRDRSEEDFREGRVLAWEDVKSRNGL
jgi:hypothetical protein